MQNLKDEISNLKNTNLQNIQYNEINNIINLLKQLPECDLVEGVKNIVELVLADNISLVISRQAFNDIISFTSTVHSTLAKSIYELLLDYIQSRLISFEEQAIDIRIKFCELLENESRWKEGADILSGLPIDSGQKVYPKEYKLAMYIRIAALYLRCGDDVQAENIMNRASLIQSDIKDEKLLIQYKECCAHILDNRKKYLDASPRYLELSYKLTNEDDRKKALKNAVNCAILSPAGQPRSKLLALLYKDDRCKHLPSFGILEKMYLDRIIRQHQLQEFEDNLASHQKIVDAEGISMLQKAITQHNLLSASKIYLNCSFEQMALLLGITEEQTENTAIKMISEGRLDAKIDQITRYIYFKKKVEDSDYLAQDLCNQLNTLYEKIEIARSNFINTTS